MKIVLILTLLVAETGGGVTHIDGIESMSRCHEMGKDWIADVRSAQPAFSKVRSFYRCEKK